MSIPPFVSIVIPVKNGGGRLEHCLESLRRQDFPSERLEIIVADGRSSDNTVEIAKLFGCRVVDNPRQTVAGGRNAGVAAAQGELIAFSEDDIVLPSNWISEGVRVLCEPSIAAVGGPTPIPPTSSAFAKAVDLIFRTATAAGYSVQSGIIRDRHEVQDIPGGNAMYRRSALGHGAALDEGLITGEDVDLHFRIRKQGYKLVFSPDFIAWHHKRDAPGRFFTQIRRFAQGRVQLGRRHEDALRPLHRVAAILPIPILIAFALSAPRTGLAALTCATAVVVALGLASKLGARASVWLPVAVGIFLVAWSIGFFEEVFRPTRDATGK